MSDNRGISLIELLIVVVVISILAAIAIPGYIGQQKKAARAEAFTNLGTLRLLEEQFFADEAAYTAGAANVAAIQVLLPGFQPDAGRNFNYLIVQNFAIDTPVASLPTYTTAQDPCFTAVATGRAGTRVTGEVYAIDCNNNKNF